MAVEKVRDSGEAVQILGLAALSGELRKADSTMAKRLREVNKSLVQRVADKAKSRFYSRVADVGGTAGGGSGAADRKSGKGSISRSRASIRGTAGVKSATVAAGGAKAPGFFGHEFGGGARKGTMQFPRHRGRDGIVLYPTVREERKKAVEEWWSAFDEAFPEVNIG